MSISENLYNLGALMKTNLEKKGITGLTGNEGLTTLANKILDIECNSSSSKSVIMHVTGDNITIGRSSSRWLITTGNVVINWGDGTSDTVNNPREILSHTYADGINEHLIFFDGIVTSLGNYCFDGCSSLTSIIIPNSVTNLGAYCFRKCFGLTNVIIPDSVTSLGDSCFSNCSSLINITISNSVTSLRGRCFDGCSSLTSVIIPDSVTSIGFYCFNGCSNLTNITISNSVTSLESGCFNGCSSLTSVIIPDSVTSIGGYCFFECSGLTNITIPNSVTSIGELCFHGCTSLANYELYWETQPIPYDSAKMPVNKATVFTIPFDTSLIYADAGYPLDNLIERESTNDNKFHWESDEVYDSDNTFPARIWEVPVNFRASFKLSTTNLMKFMTENNYFEFGGFGQTIIIGGIDQDFSIVIDDNGTKTKLSSYGDLAGIGGYVAQTGITVDLSYVDGLVTVTLPNFGSISAEYILEDRSHFDFTIGQTSSISEVTIDEI